MDVYNTRRDNLRRIVGEWGGPTSLAKKLGHSNGSYLAQLIGPNPSRVIRRGVRWAVGIGALALLVAAVDMLA